MNSSEYQITIKLANQKVDDYVTLCQSSWTVLRLKEHIAETHVNKPPIADQRLIYAGNLLKDNLTLKQIFFRDALCTELTNSNKTDFTIHLVCSQKSLKSASGSSSTTQQQQIPSTSSSGQNRTSDNGQASSQNLSNVNPDHGSQTSATSSQDRGANQPNSMPTNHPNMFSFNMSHAPEIVESLMQSDQMRQQLAVFQQLANIVASQIAQNLNIANGNNILAETIDRQTENNLSSQYLTSTTGQASQIPNFISMMNFQPSSTDQLAAAVTAANIAGLQMPNGVLNMSMMDQLNAGQTNQPFVAGTTSPQSGREGRMGILNNVVVENRASNVNGQQAGLNGVARDQPAAGDDANLGQFNLAAAGRQGAQVQNQAPVVNQPAVGAANQMADADIQGLQHDVIDWVYYSIRAIVLMTALYIHASIFRLSFLAGLLALAYYLSRRTARRATPQAGAQGPGNPIQAQQDANAVRRAPMPAGAERPPPHPAEGVADSGIRRRHVHGEDDVDLDGNDNEGNQAAGAIERGEGMLDGLARRMPFLKVCYLVVTEFLASLIPE